MLKNKQRVEINRLFFIFWAIFCIVLFILSSGRVGTLHSTLLFEWETITPKLALIPPLSYLKNIIVSFIEIAMFALACTSLGAIFISLLLSKSDNGFPNRPTRLVLIGSAFLIGSGLFSIIFLVLGWLHKLTFLIVTGITLGGLFAGISAFIKLTKPHPEDRNLMLFEELKGSDRLTYWLSIGIILLSLMYSSSRLSYDSVALYFSDAKITAMTNGIQFFLNDSFITSSFHTGIQYAVITKMFGDQAARMYSWINGLIIIIFTLALGEQLGLSAKARRIVLALLLTTTAFTDLLGDGKIDLATTAPTIAAVYWMTTTSTKPSMKRFLITGFFAGFAIISRPFNVFLLVIIFALFYLQQIYFLIKNQEFYVKPLFKNFLWLLTPILILVVFHLFANWMILGSPLAPLSNAAKLNTSAWQWSFDSNQIWTFRALYPFVVTFVNSPQSLGNISPLFLAFFPGFFIGSEKKLLIPKPLMSLTVMAAIALLLWITFFFTVVEIRYVLFIWLILYLPLAMVVENILCLNDKTSKTMEIILIIALVFASFRIVYISLDTYSPLDEQGNPQCGNHLFCDYLGPINDTAPQGSRTLTLNAYRYYLRSDLFACSTRADEYNAIRSASLAGPDKFWLEVYRQGYTYIAYERNYSIRHLYMTFSPDTENIPSWVQLETLSEDEHGLVRSYKINYINPPSQIIKTCSQIDHTWFLHNTP